MAKRSGYGYKSKSEYDTHEIVGITFDQYCEDNKELYQDYLARNFSPDIRFSFEEVIVDGHRVVVLIISAAEEMPTAFREKRFSRIGSFKANLKDYPKREIQLFRILDGRKEIFFTTHIEAMKKAQAKMDRGEEYQDRDRDFGDLQSSINVAETEQIISSEQARHGILEIPGTGKRVMDGVY